MRNRKTFLQLCMAFVLVSSLSLQGCLRDKCDMNFTYARYTPVYMSQEVFESSVAVLPAQSVQNPGKIYVKDNYLFVNEIGKGVHIFDYKTPSQPQAIAFLQVPGNYDMSVNCDKLYLDSSTDLLVFDLSDVSSPTLSNRIKNALPHITQYQGYMADASKGIVVEWTREIRTEAYDCETGIPDLWAQNEVDPSDASINTRNGRGVNPATPGIAGSMSRFAVANDFMYVVTPDELRVFNAISCESPTLVNQTQLPIPGEAEMVTATENLVLVGGTSGVSIFTTDDPATPLYLSRYEHVTSCDPVIIDGQYGYLTLRNGQGQPCGDNFTNQLDVIDFSNPSWPNTLISFPMTHPHGLAKDGDLLFIADGSAGLRVFDASNPMRIGSNEIAHFSSMNGYDVIPADGTLILVGEDGIALYNYTDPANIALLSSIPVQR